MTEVTDKYGKRVTRANGVLQDGDVLRVPMRLMDARDPGLAAAAALADAVRRNEAFDAARGHRPGFVMPQAQDAYAAGEAARDARDARLRDAYKSPPSVTPLEKAATIEPTATRADAAAVRDAVIADRDRRTSEAWRL